MADLQPAYITAKFPPSSSDEASESFPGARWATQRLASKDCGSAGRELKCRFHIYHSRRSVRQDRQALACGTSVKRLVVGNFYGMQPEASDLKTLVSDKHQVSAAGKSKMLGTGVFLGVLWQIP